MGQDAEDVALVLGPICGPVEFAVAVGVFDHLGVVPGAYGVEAQCNGFLQQGSKLDALVAAHAGVRGATSGVFVNEVLDDVFLEAFREVPHVVGDAQDVAGTPSVTGVLNGAAAPASGAQGAGHARQREVDSDDIVSGLYGAGGGHGGVHSAAHCCKYSHAGFLSLGFWQSIPAQNSRGAHLF